MQLAYATYYSPVKTAIATSPCHVESDQAERAIDTVSLGNKSNFLNCLGLEICLEMGFTTSQSMLMQLGALSFAVLSLYAIVILCVEIMALPFPSTKEV